MNNFIRSEFLSHIEITNMMIDHMVDIINSSANMIIDTLKMGNKIIICGNGGSAADSQHFAAELVGRYKKNRVAIPCIALTTDTSILTAIGNDFGFDFIFSRQVEAIAFKGDLLIAISTSGKSKNVLNAINIAKNKGCKILGLSGNNGEIMDNLCDFNIKIPSPNTARIQEMHLLIEHIICDIIEQKLG